MANNNNSMYINGMPAYQGTGMPDMPGSKPRGKHSFWKGFLAGMLAMAVLFGGLYLAGRFSGVVVSVDSADDSSGSAINSATIQKLQMLEEQIDQNYYQADSLTKEQKADGLYKGLFESLNDPYSVYYTAEEVEDLTESLTGTFSGIGAYISLDQTSGYPKISGVIAGAPAEAAGLLANDIIYEVDGENVSGQSLDEVVSKVRGEKGTDVTLTIVRTGETDYLKITITRDDVDAETVTSKVLEDGIGYLQITEFDTVTTDQFTEQLQNLYDQDIKALILDLRDNPGGDVDVVTAVADHIIPEGLIFYMEDRDGNQTSYSTDDEFEIQIPLAVLVNGNSASASEILTGAIQDSGCGTVIGTQTYGKGVVQTVYQLLDGTAVKLTVADYYTRGGNNINKVGITPDIEVELDAEAYLEDGSDNQLQTAIETLQKQLAQ